MNKICKKCCIEKSINDFPKTGKLCKICWNEYMRLRRPKKDKTIKICKKCCIEKNINEFKEKTNLCLICYVGYQSEYQKEYRKNYIRKDNYYYSNKEKIDEKYKEYYLENKEKISNKNKEWRTINKEKISNKNKEWRTKNKGKIIDYHKKYYLENKEKYKEVHKEWRENNIEHVKDYRKTYNKEKLKVDTDFKIKKMTRNLIHTALNNRGIKKNTKTELILGCSISDFKVYLESLFEDWMTFDNHGRYTGNYNETWQIDHIIPLDTAANEEEIIKLNHYTNLRPLCSKKNLEKRNIC